MLNPEDLQKRKEAASSLVQRGWHIFPVVRQNKKPFAGSRGHLDAKNDTTSLLQRWEAGEDANPAISLVASNLTVLDIDAGLVDLKHALSWAKSKGIDNTMMVVTGRANFGIHFYFTGTRPKNTIYVCESIRGDIKVNGYSVAPGAVHENGNAYTLVNGLPPAPLPDWLHDYSAEKKLRKPRVKQELPEVSAGTALAVGPNDHLKWGEEYPNQKVHHPRRHKFLLKRALGLRDLGLESDTIQLALHDLCINRCDDGKQYWKENKEKLKTMAEDLCKTRIGRARSANGPRPRPELEKQVAWLIPEGTPCDRKVILAQLADTYFYDPKTSQGRKALSRALKNLHVTTFKENDAWMYLREPNTDSKHSK